VDSLVSDEGDHRGHSAEDWRGRDGGGIHRSRQVVFVCTDMEGSTAMAAENAELYQEVQDKHDEVLSSAALAHNGYIFATQGDAFELVFPTIGDGKFLF
jgi:class 3 adenylate cyclase